MGNKQNSGKRWKAKRRKQILQNLQDISRRRRQKKILRKLNPPPKPEPEDESEPKVKPEVKRAPSRSQSIEVTGPRSCRLQKCAFRSCPNGAPDAAPHNDGVTYFAFPNKPGQDSKWAKRVSRANGEPFWPRLTSRVCQLHFPPELITTNVRGVAALQRGAVPDAEPYRKREIPNIEEVLLPNDDINKQCGSLNYSKDLVMDIEIDNENPEVKQAVASLVDIPPPENGIKLQCVNVENKNAIVHYLSVDKNNTVNHTHVNINKNNIATLHYVDNKNTVNHTLKCSNLNEDQVSSYEALVNPNLTQTRIMKTETVPNQNDQENSLGIKINSKLPGGKSLIPDKEIDKTIENTLSDNLDTDITVNSEDCNSGRETIQNTLSDNLDTDITVNSEDCNSDGKTLQNTLSDNLDTDITVNSEDCNSDRETLQNTLSDNLDTGITVNSEDFNSYGETEETILGEAGTSAGIQSSDDDFVETVVVKMEYESDNDNGLEPET